MKKLRISAFLLLVVAAALIIISACQKKEESKKTYIASGHEAWPPFMSKSGDLIIGVGPTIFLRLCQELNLDGSVVYVGDWTTVQNKAKNGEIDAIVAAYKTAERETYMYYSTAYAIDPVALFTLQSQAFAFTKFDDLIGKKGVGTTGDSYGQEFDDYLVKGLLDFQRVATPTEAFNLLLQGQADYFVYALYSGKKYLANNGLEEQLGSLPQYIASENFYLTISKKSNLANYRGQIDALLQKWLADGTIADLIANSQ